MLLLSTAKMGQKVKWLPLESNPEVITQFIRKMGIADVECVDVYGFDDELLQFLPSPCYALILCFPSYEKVHKLMAPVYEKLEKEGATVPDNVFFMKQKISNACGTFALFHSLANNANNIDLGNSSFRRWLDEAKELDVDERSDFLAGSDHLAKAHEECAQEGETAVSLDQHVEHHFICYVNVGGKLYEIDSSEPFPRDCGATTEENFLKDAGKVCQGLMSQMDDISFSAIALVKSN